MLRFTDLSDRQFGDLTARWPVGRKRPRYVVWLCSCKCGATKLIVSSDLVTGDIKSCGCRRRKHGLHNTPEYRAWGAMRSRCINPNHKEWANYGGRGIGICDRWRDSFKSFFSDMGKRPSSGHSIDRINNDGNYEPGNCRWATTKQQTRNTRYNRILTLNGNSRTIVDWAELLGIAPDIINNRLHKGWSVEESLLRAPSRKWRPSRRKSLTA